MILPEWIYGWLFTNPLLFHSLIIMASFIILAKSSDLIVGSISDYAKKFGISDYLVGLLIVAFSASMPELVSSITGASLGESGIVFGTMFGSNLFGATIGFGILALVARKIKMNAKILEGTKLDLFLLYTLPFILVIDGKLSRLDGAVLIFAFIAYLVLIWKKEGELGKLKNVSFKKLWKDAVIFVGSLLALILSGRWLVFSSIGFAQAIQMPTYLIALTVISMGATIPDIMVGIRAVLKGHEDIGFGDFLGSAILKALLFVGVIAIFSPLIISFSSVLNLILFSLLALVITFYYVRKKEMGWRGGLLLILLYVVFLFIELFLK